jgi:hypothetical protein
MHPAADTANDRITAVAGRLGAHEIAVYFRKELRQIVSTHKMMFEKLLFEEEELPPGLSELFEDVGNRYLDISDRIVRYNLARRKSQIK